MKYFLLTLALASTAACNLFAAGLSDVKTVYLMPMSDGLDQYLAERLTSGAVLQVVTDPKKADAVFTDHVGESFESDFSALYGEVPKPKPGDAAKAGDKGADNDSQTFARTGAKSRGRGAVFLVDRKSRDVIWSVYELPKQTSPDGIKHVANRISDKLAKSIKGTAETKK
jgi:hypothetical protein